MLSHGRLKVWKLAHELALEVYRASAAWPSSERYGLTGQIRRAAWVIPNNLAEGAAKRGPREFRRCADIALGSVAEAAHLLMLARDLGILREDDFQWLDDLRKRTGGLTWRLVRALDDARP